MDISEWLDDECDTKVTFEEVGELNSSVLTFSLEESGEIEKSIRIYPEGIHRLKKILDFIEKNQLISDV